jgi:hypothetical protein
MGQSSASYTAVGNGTESVVRAPPRVVSISPCFEYVGVVENVTDTAPSVRSVPSPSLVPPAGEVPSASEARSVIAKVVSGTLVAVLLATALVWHSQLDDARATLRRTRGQLSTTQQDLADTQHSLANEITQLSAQTARLTTVSSQRDQLATQLAQTRFFAGNLVAELNTATSLAGHQSSYIQAATTCLAGVQRALNQIAVGDQGGAIASVGQVAKPCQVATSPPPAVGAPATGAATISVDNAVYPFDFPDPFVVHVGGAYYGFATNSALGTIQVIRSTNLHAWTPVGNALPKLPAWAVPGFTWAPSVLPSAGGYLLYYVVHDVNPNLECISVARSSQPAGPYTDSSSGPLVCPAGLGGSIDPSPYVNPFGVSYLLFKSAGGAGVPNQIWSQQLSGDGRSLVGAPALLIGPSLAWEGGIVEAPSMAVVGGELWLLYAGNRWATGDYATGAAKCATPLGPCTKVGRPVLASSGSMAGPGGAELFAGPTGRPWVAFAAYAPANVGSPNSRLLHVEPVSIVAGTPMVTA